MNTRRSTQFFERVQTLIPGGVSRSIERGKGATNALVDGTRRAARSSRIALQAGTVGTMFKFNFLNAPDTGIADYASTKHFADATHYARFFHACSRLKSTLRSVSSKRVLVSSEHYDEITGMTLEAVEGVFAHCRAGVIILK